LVASRISSVETVGVPVLTDQVDIANTRIRFESGCIANITASRVSADVMRKIRIFQNNAYISIDFSGHSVDVYTLSQDHRIQHAGHHISESDALAAEIRSFIDALTGSGNIIVDGKAGLRAMEVAFMIKDAMINP
ncbi:MAG: gfo/Idh/MocA family oxidoreductase, partial [Thermodesulfobacteriota bacterium]|nr:gfo/Idh/MocA family oxidoreductase [Thermodesulfobacteriota bacterium]